MSTLPDSLSPFVVNVLSLFKEQEPCPCKHEEEVEPEPIPLKEYFKYHPPLTGERKNKHNQINELSLALAEAIDTIVEDTGCKKMAIFALQQARMFANQGIVIDELKDKN